MSIDEKIFKSYDIRGIYPTELNEEAAYAIGRAFARRAKAKSIVVGSDMRLSGPQLKAKLIEGITDEGTDVIDIGLVTVDTVYYAVGILFYDAGIMITASHNPREYNGFKMCLKNMAWVRGEELKDYVLNLPPLGDNPKGKVVAEDILPSYLKHVLSFCEPKKIKPLKVVIDAGNGMAGKIAPLLAPSLPIEIIPLNFQLDGNFPAHPSNPLLPESQIQIGQAVVEHRADCGVIFDGDTDRIFFVNEKGKVIRGDYTALLLARILIIREPGVSIVYNLICSKILPKKILEWGGKPVRCPVGFVNVSAAVRRSNAFMGGELSGHYCFRDHAFADSGFIAFVLLLQSLSEDGRVISEIVKEFEEYYKSPEINLEVKNSRLIIEEIKKRYQDGRQDELDGLTVEYENWWFNVRPSNTEPLLRVTIETESQEFLDQKVEELSSLVNELNK